MTPPTIDLDNRKRQRVMVEEVENLNAQEEFNGIYGGLESEMSVSLLGPSLLSGKEFYT